jgi:MOSC domain-containing protein YiiM
MDSNGGARVVSCNVGTPVVVRANGQDVLTAIYKRPVSGRVHAGRLNLSGDRQADLTVHGGLMKAVYAYPSEHYEWWRSELPDTELPWGMFGENLTTEGLLESEVAIGQQLRVGTAVFQVTQPRMPCSKLALKFGRLDMPKRFWASRRSGFYLSVVEEGDLEAGDSVELVGEPAPRITVREAVELYRNPKPSREALERALASPLAPGWKEELRERLALAGSA